MLRDPGAAWLTTGMLPIFGQVERNLTSPGLLLSDPEFSHRSGLGEGWEDIMARLSEAYLEAQLIPFKPNSSDREAS